MEVWERFLSELEMELGVETVKKWLRSLKIVDFDACNLYLEAKDAFQISWFEEQIRPRVEKSLVNNNHRHVHVHLTSCLDANIPLKKKGDKEEAAIPPMEFSEDPIDPHATFENFILGKANHVVYKLLTSLAIGKDQVGTFNPIYLYGPSGSGKSHLLMAVTEALRKRNVIALYIRTETFTEHVVRAIRNGGMREFRNAYRNVDVLIVDDIHLLAKKAATQEEFFHTFNTLHTSGRQILLAGDRIPQSIEEIEPRLISRFEWGITLPLEKLDMPSLQLMLIKRCQSLEFPLNEKVIEFLISAFQNNIKSLHRALEALVLRTHMEKKSYSPADLSIEMVHKLLSDLFQREEASALSPEKLIRCTAEHYGIRTDELQGKSQSQDCTFPRKVAMYLCREQLNIPFLKIGSLFGRDHSTVMTSVKQIKKQMDSGDKEVRFALCEILKSANESRS